MSGLFSTKRLPDPGQQHRLFFVESDRTHPRGDKIRKKSKIKVGISSGPLGEDVMFGIKIQAGQTIKKLLIDGNNLIPDQADAYVQGLLVGTFGGTKDEWQGFIIPHDWLGNIGTSFKTDFVLDGFTLMGPAFQVVPLVFALAKSGSFGTGHYIVGASVLPGKLDDDPSDPSPSRGQRGTGARHKRR